MEKWEIWLDISLLLIDYSLSYSFLPPLWYFKANYTFSIYSFYLDGLNELRGKPWNLHEDHFKPLEPGKVTFLISSHISCSPSLTFDIACVDLKIKRSYLFSPSLECKCSMTFGTLIDLKESRIWAMTERLQFHSLLETFEDRNKEVLCKTPTLAVWTHAWRSKTVNMQFDDLKNASN